MSIGAFARALAVGLALGASGCATTEATLGSMGKPGEQATVIVGIAASRHHPLQASGIAANWRQFDAAAELFLPSGGAFTLDRRTECWSRECDLEPGYAAFTVTPGDYILTYVLSARSGGRSRAELTSYFVKTRKNLPPGLVESRSSGVTVEDSTADSGSPRFTVRDGEVVYIGTFVFDTNEWPHRISAFRVDMTAAKAAVGVAVREKMVFRPPMRPRAKPAG